MPRRNLPPLARAIVKGLAEASDPTRAPAMQAYMKSSMPFRGVASAERRALVKQRLRAHPLAGRREWESTIRALFDGAEFREERYAAVDLLLMPSLRRFLTQSALPLLERLITRGAWWDYVDALAAHGMGHLLQIEPAAMRRVVRDWSRSSNLWKRRSAILAQLRFGPNTDLPLLYACIEPNLKDEEFFIRKAIGWALRQYAWINPDEIRKHVDKLGARLSPLSRREALKNVTKPLKRGARGKPLALRTSRARKSVRR
ncbi:MAG: DNA alkylation repair protein [Myxococcales bacterium]|nr:DNA alkylation repair protein [Myxococcales bacterium]